MGLTSSLLDKYGGDLNSLVSKFESSGLGDKVKSWICTGENEKVSGAEIKRALGDGEVSELAQKEGVSPDQAADRLAEDLPKAVDAATPSGTIPGVGEVKQAFSKLFG
jgi:uncharacterized protein YidB (DUF937 family)